MERNIAMKEMPCPFRACKFKTNVFSTYGVKHRCLSDHLSYFNPITGFPPDILHDLFEGVVPVELPHCLKGLIAKKYFTLEELNRAILSFPFQCSDKVDRNHPVPQNFAS